MSQNFDTAVVEAPVRLHSADVETLQYRCVCALPSEHPFASKERIKPRDLSGTPLAVLFPDHATNHQIRRAFSESGADLNVALECDFFASACSFVSVSGGAAIIDPVTAAQMQPGTMTLVPFEPAIEYELALVRPANRARSRLSEKFHDRLRARLLELQ